MKITSGPYKGYYYLPSVQLNDGSPVRDNTVYSRLKLGPQEQISGFNRPYLPYVDGYYYVPNTPGFDTRKLIYALVNKEVPSSGNTESFLRDLKSNTASMPHDYCPYYLDPCNSEWCRTCYEKSFVPQKRGTTWGMYIKRQTMIFSFMAVLSFIILMAIRS